ncbi:MAG: nicotinate-nucleotide--dimethylbenzimidazole phosphoribosyltransferase [Oscillospiraceae bacterium]|nr:nicotinate-nucleotide--dimethylbenzimidazole phosphoribosyltransferase [Oscillospiraceae bacterium]
MLENYLKKITDLDKHAMQEARAHWDNLAKPLRSLGRLEDMLIQLAGITGSAKFSGMKKAVLIFCADNGIVEEHVTQTGREVTASVTRNFTKGIATVNALAKICDADVFPIDIGIAEDLNCSGLDIRKIAYGTKNFLKESAMTLEQCEQAIITGINLVHEKKNQGYHLIITGEMGIANTTTSSAILSVLEEVNPELVTGRGAGLTSEGLKHKIEVIKKAINLYKPDKNNVLDVMAKLGGFDICGMTGAFLGGAIYHVPVMIDGFISAVSANCAVKLAPACKNYIYASHCSAEPAGKLALDAIGLKAYFDCNMCLGEGTGAVIGAKLFDFALSAYQEAVDFQTAEIEKYEILK